MSSLIQFLRSLPTTFSLPFYFSSSLVDFPIWNYRSSISTILSEPHSFFLYLKNLLLNFKIAISRIHFRTPNESTRSLPPHSKSFVFHTQPSSFAPRSRHRNLLSLYWVQLKFCSFKRLNATNQLHVFQNICYGDIDSLRVSISAWNCFFFFCISLLLRHWSFETKIYKYSRFDLILIETCSADCVFCYSLKDSFSTILHTCYRNIVVNLQQSLWISLHFFFYMNLSCI